MKPKKNDGGWADFNKWVEANDPANNLTTNEQVAMYAKDVEWHGRHSYAKSKSSRDDGGCNVEIILTATEKSVADVNALAKEVGLNKKLKPGEQIGIAYTVNTRLEGLVPLNQPHLDFFMAFMKENHDSVLINEDDKQALLQHLELSFQEASRWLQVVEQMYNTFGLAFMKQEFAKKKSSGKNNKVKIE